MGYPRTPAPHIIAASKVVKFVGERELDAVLRAADPFGVVDTCEFGPRGEHYATGSCGDVVCCYCARIFWS